MHNSKIKRSRRSSKLPAPIQKESEATRVSRGEAEPGMGFKFNFGDLNDSTITYYAEFTMANKTLIVDEFNTTVDSKRNQKMADNLNALRGKKRDNPPAMTGPIQDHEEPRQIKTPVNWRRTTTYSGSKAWDVFRRNATFESIAAGIKPKGINDFPDFATRFDNEARQAGAMVNRCYITERLAALAKKNTRTPLENFLMQRLKKSLKDLDEGHKIPQRGLWASHPQLSGPPYGDILQKSFHFMNLLKNPLCSQ